MTELEIKANIAKAEEAIKLAKAEIDKAKSAGIDVTEQEAELATAIENLEKLKAAYGG